MSTVWQLSKLEKTQLFLWVSPFYTLCVCVYVCAFWQCEDFVYVTDTPDKHLSQTHSWRWRMSEGGSQPQHFVYITSSKACSTFQFWHILHACVCVYVCVCAGWCYKGPVVKKGKNKQIKGFLCSHLSQWAGSAFKQVWRAAGKKRDEREVKERTRAKRWRWTWRWMSQDCCMNSRIMGLRICWWVKNEEEKQDVPPLLPFFMPWLHISRCVPLWLWHRTGICFKSLKSTLRAQETKSTI